MALKRQGLAPAGRPFSRKIDGCWFTTEARLKLGGAGPSRPWPRPGPADRFARKTIVRRVTASDGRRPHEALTRLAYSSVADLVVITMQDVLGLGTAARQNFPGRETKPGNYLWKLNSAQLTRKTARNLRMLADTFGRLPEKKRGPRKKK